VSAELSIRFDRIEELEEALPAEDFLRLPLPWEAACMPEGERPSKDRIRHGPGSG
jgi:hypothetical protein